MHFDTPLISTIVVGLALAFVLGAIANRFRISPLVGYLVAGVLVGPATPGFVADVELAGELAEIGVILLMFGVGLHFSLKDLLSVRAIAIPGAVGQIAIATLLGMGLAWAMGWTMGQGLVFGLALSVASTVVLLRALQDRRLVETERGRIAVGWLIVEDLAMVLTLVLLPAAAGLLGGGADDGHGGEAASGAGEILLALVIAIAKVAVFVALILVVGRRVIPWVLHVVVHSGSRELFRLAVLAIALGVAYGAALLFGVSFALGAFFAGMVMNESPLSHRAAEETLPLRDAFAVLFFVSVGMLFDPAILVQTPLPVLATLGIIIVGKSLIAFVIVMAFGYGRKTALTISASLAQIGEFSFILAALGVSLGLLPVEGQNLILAGAILSIIVNPFLFTLLDRMFPHGDVVAVETPVALLEPGEVSRKTGHVVVIGYGRVGSLVVAGLAGKGVDLLVVEDNAELTFGLPARGIETVAGNAVRTEVLQSANVAAAARVVLAIPNPFESADIIRQVCAANPGAEIIARAHTEDDEALLRKMGATTVIMGEREVARGMVDRILGGGGEPGASSAAPAHG